MVDFRKSKQRPPNNEIDENVSRFLTSYYADEENRYHSLPRYFGGTVRRDRERSYTKRSKSITHSSSGSALNTAMSEEQQQRARTMRADQRNVVEELKNYLTNSYRYNAVPSNYHSSFRRQSNNRYDDSSSEISSHSYKLPRRYDNNYDGVVNNNDNNNNSDEDVEEDFTVEKSSKKSKFFRTSSIRSLKKFVNKLRGKKMPSSLHGGGDIHHHHHHHQFNNYHHHHNSYNSNNSLHYNQTQQSQLQGQAQSSSSNVYNKNYRNSYHAQQETRVPYNSSSSNNYYNSTNAESGINTPTDSASWNNGHTTPQTSSCYPQTEISTPALCGIVNHGNTCYINAVVQCLSNTDVLAEYFLTKAYYTDLCQNLKNAEKYGSQGNVTIGLAKILMALWFKSYTPKLSEQFQRTVEQYSEQYRGGQQQDAQEFFIWLLDRVHEDLNIAVKRRYKLNKPRNKSEDEIASAAMEKHLEAHNSFISYHFHGLYLSSVTCPVCYKQSTQPDPFFCVSLPVAQSTKKPLYVIMVFLNRKPRLLCFGLNADVTATFGEVKNCLAKAIDILQEQLVLCEIGPNGFVQSFVDDNDISCLNSTKVIYAFETPPSTSSSSSSINNHYYPSQHQSSAVHSTSIVDVGGEELICLICNQIGEGIAGKKFGSPVSLKIHREVSYGDLCRSILLSIRSQLRANLLVQDIPHGVFKLRVVDDYHLLAYVPEDVAMPMYSQVVDNALASQRKNAGPVHIKLTIEWQRDAKERFFNPVEESVVDHKSAQDLRHQEIYPETQTLHECLEEFTKDESLQWYCHDCRRNQERAVKRTVFYWLPNILTLHLKRNKQLPNGQLVKLDPLVKFPIYGLDLSEFMHQPSPGTPRRSRPTNGYRVGRTKNGELYVDTKTSRCVYDLFAVVNHHGDSPNSGHYTAYCRNPVNGNWYCFDDQNVSRTDENHLVTNAAYLLFYERRLSRNVNSCHNSTESGFVDHWYNKVFWSHLENQQQQQAQQQPPVSGASSRDTLEGIDSGHSTNGSSTNARESPERPSSRQMFVALPPSSSSGVGGSTTPSYYRQRTGSNTVPAPPVRTDPPVARLISIDLPPPPQSTTNEHRRNSIDRKSSSTLGKTPFVRQQSYIRRISTNSVVETDL